MKSAAQTIFLFFAKFAYRNKVFDLYAIKVLKTALTKDVQNIIYIALVLERFFKISISSSMHSTTIFLHEIPFTNKSNC